MSNTIRISIILWLLQINQIHAHSLSNQIFEIHERTLSGWVNLSFQKNGEYISLIGVQNISGRKNFQTYGSLPKAYAGAENAPFKILMSHDPSHWDVEVLPKFPAIDLALAGHTHGMQFGVELPGFKWSPVQYVYKEWAGLYEQGKQKLYVNRGYGFIGYPGRVGIMPEITVIELV